MREVREAMGLGYTERSSDRAAPIRPHASTASRSSSCRPICTSRRMRWRSFLEAFEGPLDLLLYLIRKQNLNILDIPMARAHAPVPGVRRDDARRKNLELAAEYLLMAAMLIEIKSRMLLPRPPSADAEEEDPRAELVRRLLEYEQMKKAAHALDELPQAGRDVVADLGLDRAHDRRAAARGAMPQDLAEAWRTPAAPRAHVAPPPHLARGAFGARAHERHPARAARAAGP